MNLQELLDTLEERGFVYLKDNACILTHIDNYDFGIVKNDKIDYAVVFDGNEQGKVYKTDEKGYLQEEIFEIYSEKFIYVDKNTKYDSNPTYRLDIDKADFNLIDSIERNHEFKNRLTVAYKYLDRVFVAHEKQSADPFEVRPREKALKYFNNENWEGLVKLTL